MQDVLMCILAFIPIFSFALEIRIDPNLNEEVVFIQKKQAPPIELETTIFKPPGTGPLPLLRAKTNPFAPLLLPVVLIKEVVDRHLSQQTIMTSIEHIDCFTKAPIGHSD